MVGGKLRHVFAFCLLGSVPVLAGQGCSGSDSSTVGGGNGSSGSPAEHSCGGCGAGTWVGSGQGFGGGSGQVSGPGSGQGSGQGSGSSSGAGGCVSDVGMHCGGNTANPCTCAAGLVCTPGDSGLLFGDVGGTCEPSPDAGGGEAGIDDAGSDDATADAPTSDDASPSDGGACGPQTCSATQRCCEEPGLGGACTMRCVTGRICPVPAQCTRPDAGCVQNVLCIRGDVWDPVLCRCLPLTDGGLACKNASDCRGVLPQICAVCAEGGSGCAHWVCRGGICETALCQ